MHFTAFFRAQIYGFSDLTGVTLMAVSRVTMCHICDNHICLSFMIIPVNKKSLPSKLLSHCKHDEAVKKPRHVSHWSFSQSGSRILDRSFTDELLHHCVIFTGIRKNGKT